MNQNTIIVKNIKKSFGSTTVLSGVSFGLKKSENLIILGKSGTGKSVILQCIVRLIEPEEGKVLIFGKNIYDMEYDELNATRKHIGFLFQSAALYDSMTVRENLQFSLVRTTKIKQEELDEKVSESLRSVGLLNAIDKMPSELSGGMKKRIGLARTLIQNPDVILYDEPTTGLDSGTSKEISELIIETKDKYKVSSIIVTHDMPCAKLTSDRIIVLKDGLIYTESTYDELEKSDDKFIQSFFGY
ncbi:MAG: ATP-binding cassette domain-containing protein [Ignavibacteria bacterium]|nr:ATP-binding cassette domain-containing protein [Ignavibacteria bacterium]